MSVRVRDLEIALVLAREMKAAAARSVDASLRLDQLQEVFGVERLDRAERARIQTALQMAGLEPFPSLLEADPTEPIRFGASKGAVTAEREIPSDPDVSAPEPAEAEAPEPTFPTVGEFARSKLGGRSRRRFGLRRGDHSDGDVPPPPPPEESNGRLVEEDADATRAHEVLPEEPALEEAPAPEPDPGEPVEHDAVTAIHTVPDEPEVEDSDDELAVDEPEEELAVEEPEEELTAEEPEEELAVNEPEDELAVEEPEEELAVDEPEEELTVEEPHEEPEVEDRHDEPEVEDHPAAAEDEREYIPLVPEQPVAPEPEPPQPEPQRVGARGEEVVALLLPAVAIPVIVTSIAGWRFGLPFVALSVIATGWLLSRHGGVAEAWRRSPARGTVLKTTAAVTVLSAVAAIVLASVGKDDSTKSDNTATPPAKKPVEPSTASKPATTTPAKEPTKKKPRKEQPQATQPSEPAQPSQPSSEPPPDPSTEGLVRVPPSQAAQTPTTPTTPAAGTQGTP